MVSAQPRTTVAPAPEVETSTATTRLRDIPGFRVLTTAYTLARLPTGFVSLTIVLTTLHVTDSLSIAGWASACYAIAMAVGMPTAGRVMDRYGARVTLPATGFAYVATLALLALVSTGWLPSPVWALLLLSAAAGATVPGVAPVVRAAWADRVPAVDQPRVNALESALSHSFYVIGPAVVAVSSWLGKPGYALLAAAACNAVGVLVLTRCLAEVALPVRGKRAPLTAVFRQPGAARVLGSTFGWALTLEGLEYTVIGWAAARHDDGLAGLLLAVTAAGSFLASAVLGGRRARVFRNIPPAAWMLVWAGALVPLAVAAQLDAPLWLIAVLAVVGRLPSVGAFVILLTETTRAATAGLQIETFAWRLTVNMSGSAVGMSVCGILADHAGAGAATVFGIVCGSAVAATLAVANRGRADGEPDAPGPARADTPVAVGG